MGRYYTGDIDGKFWFGVQNSMDATHFGGRWYEPGHVDFYFDTDDLDDINAGIAKCEDELGVWKKKLDKFFDENNGYNNDMLVKAGFPKSKITDLLTVYARLKLGLRIRDRVKEHGSCEFEAEL